MNKRECILGDHQSRIRAGSIGEGEGKGREEEKERWKGRVERP